MCSTCPFQFRWLKGYIYSSCYYHNQIGCIHLYHHHIFRGSVPAWGVCYVIFCHILHIHSGKTTILFLLLLRSLCRMRFGLQTVFVCLHITPSHHLHCANFSKDIELIKRLSDIFGGCVSKIKHILSVIHYTICGAVCFQFYPFPLLWLGEYV